VGRRLGSGLAPPAGPDPGGRFGLALSAVQLLPTLELSRLSIRGGGMPYREVIAFSLKPQLLLRAFLPGNGETVFSEYVAYVGWTGLALAAAGALGGGGRPAVAWGLDWRSSVCSWPSEATIPSTTSSTAWCLGRSLPRRGALAPPCMHSASALLAGVGLDTWLSSGFPAAAGRAGVPPAASRPRGRLRALALAAGALLAAASGWHSGRAGWSGQPGARWSAG